MVHTPVSQYRFAQKINHMEKIKTTRAGNTEIIWPDKLIIFLAGQNDFGQTYLFLSSQNAKKY